MKKILKKSTGQKRLSFFCAQRNNSVRVLMFLIFFIIPVFTFSQSPSNDPVYKYFPDADPSTIDTLNAVREEAQNIIVRESIAFGLTPEHPGPMEDVLIKITGSGTDLMRANFSWYVNEKLKDTGVGKIFFSFKTGDVGDIKTVRVVIKTLEGLSINKKVSVNPADLELMWEADGYVPPFYKGKALPTPQSNIKIVALPNFISVTGKPVDQNTLVYVWKDEDLNAGLSNDSGYGKKALTLEMPYLPRSKTVSVEASSLGNSIKTKREISIEPQNPRLLFYENSPIEGVLYETVIGGEFQLTKEEFSVKAEPYFVSDTARSAGKISYEWFLNSKKITPDSNEVVTFKQESDGMGSATVRLALQNSANLFQSASSFFVLHLKRR